MLRCPTSTSPPTTETCDPIRIWAPDGERPLGGGNPSPRQSQVPSAESLGGSSWVKARSLVPRWTARRSERRVLPCGQVSGMSSVFAAQSCGTTRSGGFLQPRHLVIRQPIDGVGIGGAAAHNVLLVEQDLGRRAAVQVIDNNLADEPVKAGDPSDRPAFVIKVEAVDEAGLRPPGQSPRRSRRPRATPPDFRLCSGCGDR